MRLPEFPEGSVGYDTYRDACAVVAKLDRSSIGRFAVSIEYLTVAVAYFFVLDNELVFTDVPPEASSADEALLAFYRYIDNTGCTNEIIAETLLWGLTTQTTDRFGQGVLNRFETLYFVSNQPPEFADYFLVGIWDVNSAKRYATAGIDPEIAHTLEMA